MPRTLTYLAAARATLFTAVSHAAPMANGTRSTSMT